MQVHAGKESAALFADGSALYWGRMFGPDPRPMPGLPALAALPTSGNTDCVITADGGAMCWGNDAFGRLGNGAAGSSDTPVDVVGLSGVVELAAAGESPCARLDDGTIHCWGKGPLGDGSEGDSPVPVQVLGIEDAAQLRRHSSSGTACALLANGEVWCWGSCSAGQCGAVSHDLWVYAPVRVAEIPLAVRIAVGIAHVCAQTGDAEVYCWGLNIYGQLGNGEVGGEDHLPQRVVWPWE